MAMPGYVSCPWMGHPPFRGASCRAKNQPRLNHELVSYRNPGSSVSALLLVEEPSASASRKYHLALDSPEMLVYTTSLPDCRVPVMMHIQNFPCFPRRISSGRETYCGSTSARRFSIDRRYPSAPVDPGVRVVT